MGLLKITPVARNWIEALLAELDAEAVDRLDMTSLLSKLLQKVHVIEVLSVNEPWLELDTPEDLELYKIWNCIARLYNRVSFTCPYSTLCCGKMNSLNPVFGGIHENFGRLWYDPPRK